MNHERLDYIRMLISGSYTTKGGKISKFGTVCILDGSVSPEPLDEDAGLEIWAKALHDHREGNFKAVCVKDTLVITDKEGEAVAAILPEEMIPVHMKWWHRIFKDGWALTIYEDGWTVNLTSHTLEAILMAERGERPNYLDNSAVIKVPSAEIGSKVLAMSIGCNAKNQYLVFSEGGEILEHQELYPLSFKKWDPESEGAKYSRG